VFIQFEKLKSPVFSLLLSCPDAVNIGPRRGRKKPSCFKQWDTLSVNTGASRGKKISARTDFLANKFNREILKNKNTGELKRTG
jgi:hypothetical protein